MQIGGEYNNVACSGRMSCSSLQFSIWVEAVSVLRKSVTFDDAAANARRQKSLIWTRKAMLSEHELPGKIQLERWAENLNRFCVVLYVMHFCKWLGYESNVFKRELLLLVATRLGSSIEKKCDDNNCYSVDCWSCIRYGIFCWCTREASTGISWAKCSWTYKIST